MPAASAAYRYSADGSLSGVDIPASGTSSAITLSYSSDGDGLRSSRGDGTYTDHLTRATAGGLPLQRSLMARRLCTICMRI